MIKISYNKFCDCGLLQSELTNNDFLVDYIMVENNTTTIYLNDSETKDPSDIVNAHIVPTPINEIDEIKEQLQITQEALDFILMGGI